MGKTRAAAAAAAAVGDSLTATAVRRLDTHCEFVVNLVVSGCIARTATTEARKQL